KWDFVYEGNKISAYIADEGFWNKVNARHLSFSSGDILIVDLEIIKIFDSEINTYVNKNYRVVKFIGHVPGQAPEQLGLSL
ncbi:MAG: hypothetical protein ACPLRU_04075, partial [Desulfofundulus sp.]